MKLVVRNNNVVKALTKLKKKPQHDGIFNELRNREHFVSNVQVGREYRKVRGTACMENGVWIMKELY